MIEQKQLEASIAKAAADVRANNPLAGSITNTVTIDFVANAQLAVGGSAAMVYLPDEGETLVAAGGAVYLNMGTLFPVYEETIPRTAAAAPRSNGRAACWTRSTPRSPRPTRRLRAVSASLRTPPKRRPPPSSRSAARSMA